MKLWKVTALLPFLALLLALFPVAQSSALSVSDLFTISYTAAFASTSLTTGETGSVTVTGSATCKQDLSAPYNLAQAVQVIGRIVAISSSGARVILNPGYTIDLNPFPHKAGETVTASQTLTLQFPSDAKAGDYSVSGETIHGTVQVFGQPFDITSSLPSSVVLGKLKYVAAASPQTAVTALKPTPISTPLSAPVSAPTGTVIQKPVYRGVDWWAVVAILEGAIIAIGVIVVFVIRRRRNSS